MAFFISRYRAAAVVFVVVGTGGWSAARAAAPGGLCVDAIAGAEQAGRLPDAFLSAIGRVESGRTDPATGIAAPWPWTVNARGVGTFYGSKAEAVAAVRALSAEGVRSIDVGCMQVNLMHHPEAFASLEQAFDPAANAGFAATLLRALFKQTGSWPHAAAAYHSQTPTIGADYQKKVLAEWAAPDQAVKHAPRSPSGKAVPSMRANVTAPPRDASLRSAAIAPVPPGWAGRPVTYFAPGQPPHMLPGASPAPSGGGVFAGDAGSAPAVSGGIVASPGRSLAAYRRVPVPLAWRLQGGSG